MIRGIDCKYDAEYIASVFWNKEIAKVSSITLIPQVINGKILNIAYITISSYCETEAAYNLIARLRTEVVEIVHDNDKDSWEDSWWVERNHHNSGSIFAGSFTTKFDEGYFRVIDEVATEIDDEDLFVIKGQQNDDDFDDYEYQEYEEPRPIRDMWGQEYTVSQAEKCVKLMKEESDIQTDKNMRDQELAYLENELNIYKAIQKSQTVTVCEKRDTSQYVDVCGEEERGITLN
jgi:hypothetical protein